MSFQPFQAIFFLLCGGNHSRRKDSSLSWPPASFPSLKENNWPHELSIQSPLITSVIARNHFRAFFLSLSIYPLSLSGKAAARHLCVFLRAFITCPLCSTNLHTSIKRKYNKSCPSTGNTIGVSHAEFGCRRLCSNSWLQ